MIRKQRKIKNQLGTQNKCCSW